MNVLDRLDELEREATLKGMKAVVREGQWEDWNDEEIALQRYSRNHLRALIDVARAAEKDWRHVTAEMSEALAPLLAEEGGER